MSTEQGKPIERGRPTNKPWGIEPSREEWIAENPKFNDTFTRKQIIQYLERIPLGYRSQSEHEVTENLITRAQMHFWKLSTDFEPPWD